MTFSESLRLLYEKDFGMIRRATIDDTPRLLPLLSELGYPATLEDLNRRFLKFSSNSGFGVAVCEMNEEITGFVAWTKTDHLISDATRFFIVGIVVSANHRNMGIGKKLMKFVEDIAKQHSPAIIDLTSGLRRAQDGTHEFYKRIGYENEGHMAKLYLRKEL
ncbi:aminoalkylphosphonic acid N-acetyltransferase [Holospora elegans E1]|uniref:Aminoalkylphosphonic acid N-acetyltransferase n=1 Tax=Holospora elegans E1 TaxID=1427503 RepID=A0A023DYX8_9PROT|nr:GNAT family N-acetyltransferase [Holospora elegans]GAJ46721.1 aminoalkylphosphonic acid N-acetyltransferase [Holospora elegans E1]